MRRIICLLLFFVILGGCGSSKNSSSSTGNKTLYVVTTTGMVADAVRNVGKDHVRVEGLMGPSVDPHLYKATAADAKKLSQADVIIYNGLKLEGKMGNIFTKMGRKKGVYAVTEDMDEKSLREPAEFHGLYDPHVWFNVSLWKKAVQKIEEALVESDPSHAADYKKNAQEYLEELDKLHQWTKEQMQSIPEENRVLVTAHDAFGYFGDAYGVQVKGLQGISTESEYGVKDVENIVEFLTKGKIAAVFVESSVPKKSIEAVVQGCLARGHKVNIGGTLFSDAMGKEGTTEGTYVGMVRHNVKTITQALKRTP